MRGHLNLDGGTLNLDGRTLTLDYNLSTAYNVQNQLNLTSQFNANVTNNKLDLEDDPTFKSKRVHICFSVERCIINYEAIA